MGLGSLNFSASNRGPWKITALNMTYAVCSSYPAVVVVPESTSDETLISVSSQFQHNRFPVVTWKSPSNQAVLLRSGCFVPSATPQKFGPLGNLPTAVLPGKNKLIGVAGRFAGAANKEKVTHPQANGGTGVFNMDVEGYMLDILHLSQSYRRKRRKTNFLSEISRAPETMHFDPPERTPGKHGWRRQASKMGARTKSWESDDVDFSPRRRHLRNGNSSERSLTPEPQLDRMLSSPEPVGKGQKRRFTISNVMHKVRSPHIARRKRYKVAKSSGDVVIENAVSQSHGEREEDEGIKMKPISRGGEEGKAVLDEAREHENPEDRGSKEEGEQGKRDEIVSDQRRREASVLTSSGQESIDLEQAIRDRGLEDLGAMSPTQGIPKLLSLKRGSSTPDLHKGGVARGGGVAVDDVEGIDLGDIEMREKRETSISPESGKDEEEEERRKSAIDWERVGGEAVPGETTPTDLESRPSTSTPDLQSGSGSRLDMDGSSEFWGLNSPDFEGSPATFSMLPTNPRDWITVDALPAQLHHWSDSALYIIGDKQALREVPDDLFPNCTFVPVEVPAPSDVSQCFKKLMRACAPSNSNSGYLAAVEESGWMTQLSTVLEMSVAVADLIHNQESSVMVCLENGWDATAQVVSLAQILLDPYYRTIEGFQALVEKDWLSFGHRFSQNGNHTISSNVSGFTPIFLQFLDLVHQVFHQFPLSFEFSDFYLRMMAYHHSSMRFHTFTLNNEKERYANNWLQYRPRHANVHGSSCQTEPYVAYWSHLYSLHSELTILYNFKYKPDANTGPLFPHSYQANLELWSFYLANSLSQFSPYDTEFLSEGDLTPVDLHYNLFEKEKSLTGGQKGAGFSGVDLVTGLSGIGTLLLEYTALINLHGQKKGLPSATWRELWEELQDSVGKSASPILPVQPCDRLMLSHGQALHKRTTMAVLIKGKLAVELEDQMTYPHNFVSVSLTGQHECEFCKHSVTSKQAYKCSSCGSVCHEHCKSKVPFNCGHKHDIAQKKKKTPAFPERAVWLHRTPSSGPHAGMGGVSSPQLDAATMDGVLLKRGKIVKSWKWRYFILNPEKKELCYYDSKKKEKCHGVITLTDEDSVEQGDPQIVPGLKPNENGYFFNVSSLFSNYTKIDAELC
ncbi:Myotubularin-related protein 5 [Geodia barretti]|uniref:Myotubularin-related protein 5 n=1 Tax=Geodia barretti TaxID=519541 RepID=A0AA35WNR4_GEOBA|nr:Myotubularin-related protein 5 [Geodia barretti]